MENITLEYTRYHKLECMRKLPCPVNEYEISNSLSRIIILEKTFSEDSREADPILPFITDIGIPQFKRELKLKKWKNDDEITRYIAKLIKIGTRKEDLGTITGHFEGSSIVIKRDKDEVIVQKLSKNIWKTLEKYYSGEEKDYEKDVICLVLRYLALGGFGNQWAIKSEEITENVDLELFASAINHNFDTYCSLFYDVEKKFGSIGDYHEGIKRIKNGMYVVANPPYVESIIDDVSKLLLEKINDLDRIHVTMVLPSWTDMKSIQDLLHSKYCVDFRNMGDMYDKMLDKIVPAKGHKSIRVELKKG